jgi:hypothetical protein
MFANIQQYIGGEWVDLITMPFEDEDEVTTDEQIEEALKALTELIFDYDKIKIILEKEVVIFNRLDGPVKILVVDQDYNKLT